MVQMRFQVQYVVSLRVEGKDLLSAKVNFVLCTRWRANLDFAAHRLLNCFGQFPGSLVVHFTPAYCCASASNIMTALLEGYRFLRPSQEILESTNAKAPAEASRGILPAMHPDNRPDPDAIAATTVMALERLPLENR